MKQVGPLPKTLTLANSLAQRVHQLREIRNMTIRDLAKSTKFGVKRIEEIEAGMETWLSATDRQLLAKSLSIEPALIEEVENRYNKDLDMSHSPIPVNIRTDLARAILEGTDRLRCPACGENLRCNIQRGFDINEQPIELARANCTRCPFIL
jgi:transcriptional regulator with XRE-family HTH domain